MTIEELNAIYEQADFGNNAKYSGSVAPMAVNTNVASIPNVAQINNIQPYLPIINQGGNDGDGGITTINNRIDSNNPIFRDPFNNILENYIQENEINPNEFLEKYSDKMFNVQETKSKGIGIQSLIDAYQKFSPMANIMKLGNNVLTNTQKYFADKKETKRLFEIQEAEKARQLKIAQEQIRVAEEQKAMQRVIEQQAMDEAAYRNQPGQYGGDNRQQEREQAGPGYSGSGTAAEMGSFKKGGRTGYGKGGIVTL